VNRARHDQLAGYSVSASHPLITVVTPSYNQGGFLEETIHSVLSQDYPAVEYIIIDGGSTDGSVDIIRRYEGRLAYWVSEPDQGQSHALNKGFARAHGEILAWLNADDLYRPHAVQTVADAFSRSPSDGVVTGGWEMITEAGTVARRFPSSHSSIRGLLLTCDIGQPSTFFRRALFEKVGGLDEGLHYSFDYDLWLRLLSVADLRSVGNVLSAFRLHSSSKTGSQRQAFYRDDLRVIDKYLASPTGQALPQAVRRTAQAHKLLALLQTLDPGSPAAPDVLSRLSDLRPPVTAAEVARAAPYAILEQSITGSPNGLDLFTGALVAAPDEVIKVRHQGLRMLVHGHVLSARTANVAWRMLYSTLLLHVLVKHRHQFEGRILRAWLRHVVWIRPVKVLTEPWLSLLARSWWRGAGGSGATMPDGALINRDHGQGR